MFPILLLTLVYLTLHSCFARRNYSLWGTTLTLGLSTTLYVGALYLESQVVQICGEDCGWDEVGPLHSILVLGLLMSFVICVVVAPNWICKVYAYAFIV